MVSILGADLILEESLQCDSLDFCQHPNKKFRNAYKLSEKNYDLILQYLKTTVVNYYSKNYNSITSRKWNFECSETYFVRSYYLNYGYISNMKVNNFFHGELLLRGVVVDEPRSLYGKYADESSLVLL